MDHTESFDAFSAACPSRHVLDDVVSRWGSLVLVALLERPLRFAETARAVGGISDRMLSQTLKALERDGLVRRSASADGSRVEYALTEPGSTLARALEGLLDALYDVMPAVLAGRT